MSKFEGHKEDRGGGGKRNVQVGGQQGRRKKRSKINV